MQLYKKAKAFIFVIHTIEIAGINDVILEANNIDIYDVVIISTTKKIETWDDITKNNMYYEEYETNEKEETLCTKYYTISSNDKITKHITDEENENNTITIDPRYYLLEGIMKANLTEIIVVTNENSIQLKELDISGLEWKDVLDST